MRSREAQNGRTLLEIALDYRTGANGSFERSEENQAQDRKLLLNALKTWVDDPILRYQAFDNAVKSLIVAALIEGELS